MAAPAIAGNNPLLNPNQSLSGKSMLQAAQGLVDAQTAGPLAELAKQIAANNAQSQTAINQTGGYFHQLGQQAQQAVGTTGQVGDALNGKLQGIGQDEQQQLHGIGDNAMSSLLKYAPQSDSSNSLAAPALQSLATEIARQQGLAAQNQGAFQSFGATQGANYHDLAASNLGTFGLKGQEALRGIAQAGQLKNEPLMGKVANIQAARGSDLVSALGKVRQQEIANQISQAGLGIKAQANQINQANNIRTNQTSSANNARTTSTSAANNAATNAQSNLNNIRTTTTSASNNALNNATKRAAATGKALSVPDNNKALTQLGEIQAAVKTWQQQGIKNGKGQVISPHPTDTQMRQVLGGRYNPVLIEAAFQLLGYGSIDQSTAAQLHSMGVRGGTYNGAPIKVTANFNPNNPAQNPPGVAQRTGNAISNAGAAIGRVFSG